MNSIKSKIEEVKREVESQILVQTYFQVRRQYWKHIEKVGNQYEEIWIHVWRRAYEIS